MRLEANDICFGYEKGQPILSHLNIAIESGEKIALIGPSGCGKSTISQLLAGYEKPWSGTIRLNGNPLPKAGYHPVQLIYQHPERAINPKWKLAQTLNEGWRPDEAFIQAMGIEPQWLNRYPLELSGGEMQRFCIARALGPDTKFILADEISTMLDVITQAQIWELMLKNIEERNLGLLVVTHNEALAERLCSKIIYFDDINRSDEC